MKEYGKSLMVSILWGCAAAFMMLPILEDYPLIHTIILTSVDFGLAGYLLVRILKRMVWYGGLVANVPLWGVLLWVGTAGSAVLIAVVASGLLSSYVGMFIAQGAVRPLQG